MGGSASKSRKCALSKRSLVNFGRSSRRLSSAARAPKRADAFFLHATSIATGLQSRRFVSRHPLKPNVREVTMRLFAFATFIAVACAGVSHAAAPAPILFQNPQGGELF